MLSLLTKASHFPSGDGLGRLSGVTDVSLVVPKLRGCPPRPPPPPPPLRAAQVYSGNRHVQPDSLNVISIARSPFVNLKVSNGRRRPVYFSPVAVPSAAASLS